MRRLLVPTPDCLPALLTVQAQPRLRINRRLMRIYSEDREERGLLPMWRNRDAMTRPLDLRRLRANTQTCKLPKKPADTRIRRPVIAATRDFDSGLTSSTRYSAQRLAERWAACGRKTVVGPSAHCFRREQCDW